MNRKVFHVTVKVVREYSASIDIRARNQSEADEIALDEYHRFRCSEDFNYKSLSLGFPPPWDEHENFDYEPEIDMKFRCVDCGKCTLTSGEYYMVSDDVWASAGLKPNDGMLCLRDLERRIGRELAFGDFTAQVPSLEAWERHVADRSESPALPPEQLTML